MTNASLQADSFTPSLIPHDSEEDKMIPTTVARGTSFYEAITDKEHVSEIEWCVCVCVCVCVRAYVCIPLQRHCDL